MATENNLTPHFIKPNESLFKCDICVLTFRTSSERNVHILDHFRRKTCSICHQTLVQLGNIWYGEHEHSNHDDIKTEFESDGIGECVTEPLVFSKSDGDDFGSHNTKMEVDPIGNWISEFDCEEGVFGVSSGELVSSENVAISELMSQSDDILDLQNNTRSVRTSTKRKRAVISTQQSWQCEICKLKFSFEANLIEHKNVYHRDEDEILNKLKDERNADDLAVGDTLVEKEIHSNATAESDASKDRRMRIRKICDICKKTFYCRKSLISHLKQHFHWKPFGCDICSRTYAHKRSLDKHKKEHLPKDKEFSDVENSGALSIRSYEDVTMKQVSPVDWVCEYCNNDFEYDFNLAKHISKDHSEDNQGHQCNICAKQFSALNDLLVHMRAHPESTQHKCTFNGCSQGFAYKANLATHLNKHNRVNGPITRKTQEDLNETKTFVCHICSKELANRSSLTQHIKLIYAKADERIKCTVPECDKIFKSRSGLVQHIQMHHPTAVKSCELCSRKFYSEAKLAEHQLKHDGLEKREFTCSICPKTFKMKHELRVHINNHEKKLTCNICDEKFACAKEMMEHRERHGRKQILTCRFKNCNQVFEDRREFMAHASQHPESEKKKVICPYCGNIMLKRYLQDHINTHTGEKPHECVQCKKKFAKKCSLYRHAFIHTGRKPYVCDIEGCDKAYRESIDLKRHKFSVHKIYTKKHICSICSKVFPERKLLTKHTANVHNKVDATELT